MSPPASDAGPLLIPLDGSAIAEQALVQLRPLMRDRRSILVRVVETIGLDPVIHAPLVARSRQEANEYLARVAEPLRPDGIDVSTAVREGLAAEQIVEVSGQERAKWIALTTHGRAGLARWVFGSVAERLIRTSPIPLLVLRT